MAGVVVKNSATEGFLAFSYSRMDETDVLHDKHETHILTSRGATSESPKYNRTKNVTPSRETRIDTSFLREKLFLISQATIFSFPKETFAHPTPCVPDIAGGKLLVNSYDLISLIVMCSDGENVCR